jgi:hypothetical protein
MRCCFSQICLATLNDTATHTCGSANIACDECGALCDGGKLCFLLNKNNLEFIKRLADLGIDDTNNLAFLCYMDFSNRNTDCAHYMCKQTMCQNLQGVPDICMLIVSENKTVFAPIECKCSMVQRGRKLVTVTLIEDIRTKVNRLCQQPSFVILLLSRELYNRVIKRENEFIENNIYLFPCVEHACR